MWLLVPMPWTLIEMLNIAGGLTEDQESNADLEPEETDDEQVDDEPEDEGDDHEDLEDDHQSPAGWAPDWRPDLFNPEKVVPVHGDRAAAARKERRT